jgi:hypothetical protein
MYDQVATQQSYGVERILARALGRMIEHFSSRQEWGHVRRWSGSTTECASQYSIVFFAFAFLVARVGS